MANQRQPSTLIIDKGGFNDPQLQVSQDTSTEFSRLRINNSRQQGFWDIAVARDNLRLNIFSSFTGGHNIISLEPRIVSIDGTVRIKGGTTTVDGAINCNGTINCDILNAQDKNFVQTHPNDATKEIVYVSLEGAEAGIYERGTARLVDGQATIDLPEHFGLVASEEGLTVHLTPRGQWLQLFTKRLDTACCVVSEAQGRSGEFDYLIHAVRKGRENHQVIRTRNLPDTAEPSRTTHTRPRTDN